MKRIFMSILAVGTALALAAPVWAGGEMLSDTDLDGIEAGSRRLKVDIENSCILCKQHNKEIDVDVDVDIEKSFNKVYASKNVYKSRSYYRKTINKNGSWRDMSFDNGILIGDDVENNNAVNFIMANGGSSKGRKGGNDDDNSGGSGFAPNGGDNGGKKGKNGNGGGNQIAAQNNFLMLKADGRTRGAHAHGVNQINNAFGGVYVDQSDSTYVSIKKIDVDIKDSFNKTYESKRSYSSSYSSYKNVDVDVDVHKTSVYVAPRPW